MAILRRYALRSLSRLTSVSVRNFSTAGRFGFYEHQEPNKDAPGELGFDYTNRWGKDGTFRDSLYLKECFIPRDCVQERVYIIATTHPKAIQEVVLTDDTVLEGPDGLGLDSLDMVEFIIALEHEFKIEVPDWEADRLVTVGDAVDLIADHPHAL